MQFDIAKYYFKDFISRTGPIYTNGDLKIIFNPNADKGSFLSAMHHGWNCPSMYDDSPPEDGCCTISNYFNGNRGLFLEFTEDNYSWRTYLVLQIIDHDSIIVIKDDYGRASMVLNLDTISSTYPDRISRLKTELEADLPLDYDIVWDGSTSIEVYYPDIDDRYLSVYCTYVVENTVMCDQQGVSETPNPIDFNIRFEVAISHGNEQDDDDEDTIIEDFDPNTMNDPDQLKIIINKLHATISFKEKNKDRIEIIADGLSTTNHVIKVICDYPKLEYFKNKMSDLKKEIESSPIPSCHICDIGKVAFKIYFDDIPKFVYVHCRYNEIHGIGPIAEIDLTSMRFELIMDHQIVQNLTTSSQIIQLISEFCTNSK